MSVCLDVEKINFDSTYIKIGPNGDNRKIKFKFVGDKLAYCTVDGELFSGRILGPCDFVYNTQTVNSQIRTTTKVLNVKEYEI